MAVNHGCGYAPPRLNVKSFGSAWGEELICPAALRPETPPQHGSTTSPFLCPIKSENGENSSFQVFSKEKMAEKQSVWEVKGGSSEFVSEAADVLFCYVPSGPALSLWGKVADFTGGCSHWELKPWIYMPVLQELTVCFSLKLQVTQAEAPQANGRANSFI